VSAVDQALDEELAVLDMTGCAGLVGGRQNTHDRIEAAELGLDAVGTSPPRIVVGGEGENLVVDVRDVADQCDFEASVGEPSCPQVVDECAAQVPDVGRGLNGRSADVDADLPVSRGNEVTHSTHAAVVDLDHHASSSVPVGSGSCCRREVTVVRSSHGRGRRD
jgi:hypothetical protein